MSADSRSLRNRWSDFFGSLRTQISAAFAVGLPADDAPGYMTRNGLGSLEVGAFRDRTGD